MPLNLLCACLLLLPAGDKKAGGYPRAELLIEAAELARPEVANQYRILDARPRAQYLAGHVPGAVWVDHNAWAKAFAAGQDPKEWSKRLGALGVGPTADGDRKGRVIVYDDGSVKDASRIWWVLRYWGVPEVRLVNGGWKAWREGDGPVSKDEPQIVASPPVLAPQAGLLATKDQLLNLLTSKGRQIIDTRSEAEYCGDTKSAKRNGAIPGAIHLEWTEVLDKKTRRFKTAAELAKLFKDAGIDVKQPAVTHCQSGGRAAVMAFALELMGARDVRNYYRSWAEWGNAEDTPVVRPKQTP
jgi:thiosulfate/3-mercaptopyruvate sulfurtransferase